MKMAILLLVILAVTTQFAVRSGLVTLSFNRKNYDHIIADLRTKVTHLEALASEAEEDAKDFLEAHLNAKSLGEKARRTADNIGKLFG